ncbi:MAG: class I SAM-dependent methyltransferase [Hyphomicrobiales bacterium]|nr:class I SAM-dependent methyltransferase [Hyphomicrobiales bacterium]
MDRPRKPPKTSAPQRPSDRRERSAPPRGERPRDRAEKPVAAEPIEPPRPPIDPAVFSGRRPLGDALACEMLQTDGWSDYALLDSGFGRKLERYGHIRIVRPEEQALWAPRLSEADWAAADAAFTGDVEEEGPGRWRFARKLPETWPMSFDPVKFSCRFTSFRHTGVFPEQVAHWLWMRAAIERAVAAGRRPKLLNLFGYTGLASLVAAAAGAEVTHVDASKKSIAWARENQAESGLDHLPIRWICDDAMKFVQRDLRRGARYDAILLDPPKYGRGTNGEVWQLFEHLPEMLRAVRALLSDGPIGLMLTVYAMRSSYASFHELTEEAFAGRGGRLASGELFIREAEAPGTVVRRRLATSLWVRWTPEEPTR